MVQQPPGPPGGMQPPPPPPGQPPQAPMGAPRAQLDTSNLPIPDIVVGVGALLSWIVALLGWYKISADYAGFGVSATGKGGYQWLPWVVYFLLFLFAGFMIANEMGNFISLSLPVGPIYIAAAVLGTLLTILAILFKPSVGFGIGVKMGMNWVVWIIMIIVSLIPIVGGYLKIQQS
jgi:hypothetical protein